MTGRVRSGAASRAHADTLGSTGSFLTALGDMSCCLFVLSEASICVPYRSLSFWLESRITRGKSAEPHWSLFPGGQRAMGWQKDPAFLSFRNIVHMNAFITDFQFNLD